MKKIGWNILVLLGLVSLGYAQADTKAKAILDKVSATYQHHKTIQSDFVLVMDNPQQGKNSTSGRLILEMNSGKYNVVLGKQEFISDGKTQWTIMKDQNEVQVTAVDNSSNSLNPTNLFTFYKKGYKSVFTGVSEAGGKSLNTIELAPVDTKQNVFKIKMRIDKASNLIYDATVFDKGGGKYTYTIQNTIMNKAIPAGTFTFNKEKYPGMEIVDLR